MAWFRESRQTRFMRQSRRGKRALSQHKSGAIAHLPCRQSKVLGLAIASLNMLSYHIIAHPSADIYRLYIVFNVQCLTVQFSNSLLSSTLQWIYSFSQICWQYSSNNFYYFQKRSEFGFDFIMKVKCKIPKYCTFLIELTKYDYIGFSLVSLHPI